MFAEQRRRKEDKSSRTAVLQRLTGPIEGDEQRHPACDSQPSDGDINMVTQHVLITQSPTKSHLMISRVAEANKWMTDGEGILYIILPSVFSLLQEEGAVGGLIPLSTCLNPPRKSYLRLRLQLRHHHLALEESTTKIFLPAPTRYHPASAFSV